MADRIVGKISAETIVDPETGELIVEEGATLTKEMATALEIANVCAITLKIDDEHTTRVVSNGMVDMRDLVDYNPRDYEINEKVRYSVV